MSEDWEWDAGPADANGPLTAFDLGGTDGTGTEWNIFGAGTDVDMAALSLSGAPEPEPDSPALFGFEIHAMETHMASLTGPLDNVPRWDDEKGNLEYIFFADRNNDDRLRKSRPLSPSLSLLGFDNPRRVN